MARVVMEEKTAKAGLVSFRGGNIARAVVEGR